MRRVISERRDLGRVRINPLSVSTARSIPLRSEATEVLRCRELRRCAQGALCRSELGRKVPGDPKAGIVVPVVLLVPVAVRRAWVHRKVAPGTAAHDTPLAIPCLPRRAIGG